MKGVVVAAWAAVVVLATVLVAYPLGPVFQHREQHRLLASFRTDIRHAAYEREGLAGLVDEKAAPAPSRGDAVGIVDVGPLDLRQVAVEGVDAPTTQRGPGHLPGSAGLGQPGNAVLVGRRSTWGGPFAKLGEVRRGALIVTSTTQGQSVYRVRSVEHREVRSRDVGPTDDDRLTLVTSASRAPVAGTDAVVVVAGIVGRPFEPTPQGVRSSEPIGSAGGVGSSDRLMLLGLVFALAAIATAFAHRTWKPLVAYLLTTPALVVLAIATAESASAMLPAWA